MAYHIWQVGLDIQNGFMRALAVQRRRRGWQLRQWWQIPLPADTLRDGSLHQSKALCDVLTQWRHELPQHISLRVAFPAQRILQQRLKAPDRRVREPERSWYIEHQAARRFPLGSESLVLDYRSEPHAPDMLLITAAHRSEVAQWQQCLERAGCRLDVLDIVPCAVRGMASHVGVNPASLLLHCLEGGRWLWISPLSQPLAFGVLSNDEIIRAGDVLSCVSDHYHGDIDPTLYCSGTSIAMPLPAGYSLAQWSPFPALQQVQPPLPLSPQQFVVAGGLALRVEAL